jgi:hypothetical protein
MAIACAIFFAGCYISLTLDKGLAKIAERISDVDGTVSTQTGQLSWLVSHYAKPVRPIYIWEESKCQWCGQTAQEDQK